MMESRIVEVRTYHTHWAAATPSLEFFLKRARPAQEAHGIRVLEPFEDLQDPNAVIWLRSFPSLEVRERLKREFYEGPIFKDDLEPLLTPLLDRYSAVVARAQVSAARGSLVNGE